MLARASVKCTVFPPKYFLLMLSFETKRTLLMEDKTRSSSLIFLIRELILSFTKTKEITTFCIP